MAVAYKRDPALLAMKRRLIVTPKEPVYMYVVAGRKVYRLQLDSNGLWRDRYGVVWALQEDHASLDINQVCGVFPFALPNWHIFRQLNDACARHDYMYSTPAFQYFTYRKDADEYLEMLVGQTESFGWLGMPFKWLSRVFGGRFWERSETR